MLQKILLQSFLMSFLGLKMLAVPDMVKLSSFNPQRADATKAFRAAINSGAPKVIIDNPGFPLQINTIHLRSNQEVIFEDGVIIEAKKNSFTGLGPFLFSGKECNNIILRGKGKVVIRMRKKDYQDPKRYRHSEWRHLFGLKGCTKIKILNLTLLSSGGDGIYLGNTVKVPYCKDILLEDLVISDHHRQGISVISAENLTIRRCLIKNTSGTNPAAGIDFEPNSKPKGQRLVNCLIEDCQITGNKGAGIEFYTVYMEACPPQSITIRNCLIAGNEKAGLYIKTSFHREGREKSIPPTGFIKFKDCRILDNYGPAILIKDQLATVKLSFKDCFVKVSKNARSYPILLAAQTMRGAPIGGIKFKNLTIDKLPAGREVMPFKSWTSASVADIDGNIFIKTSKGKKIFPIKKHIRKTQRQVYARNNSKFLPASTNWRRFICSSRKKSDATTELPGVKTRDHFYYVIYAEKGEDVKIKVKKIASIRKRKVKLKLVSIKKEILRTEMSGKKNTKEITFTAPETGCYLLSGSSGAEKMTINSTTPGGWCLSKKPLTVAGKHNKLFFAVPEGVKSFELEVAGCLNWSLVKATIRNADGKIATSNNHIEQPYRFKLKRRNSDREIWSLDIEIDSPAGIAFLRQGKSLEGFFAASPDNILKKH